MRLAIILLAAGCWLLAASFFRPTAYSQQPAATIILDAPASIPSVPLAADGTCPAASFDLTSSTVISDATSAINAWINSEYRRIRVTEANTTTILFQFPADTCYRLDGTNAGGIVIKDKDNIRVEGHSYVVVDANGNPLPSRNMPGFLPSVLPNRDDNGNPYPEIKVTTVFKVIRQLRLNEVSYNCTAWSIGANCYSNRRHVWVQNGSDVTLRNLRVEGENLLWDQGSSSITTDDDDYGTYKSYWEFEHAFAVHGGVNMTFENLQAQGIYGDGFYSQGNTDGLTLTNFKVSYNGRQGVAFSQSRNVIAENVQILNTRRAGFDLEPIAGWLVRNVLIKNSYTRGYHVAFAAGGRGDVNGITLQNNKISGPGVPWIYVVNSDGFRRYNWRVYDNEVTNTLGSPQAAMRFDNVSNIDIQRNISRVRNNQSRNAVGLTGAAGTVIIVDNDFGSACTPYNGDVSGVTTLTVTGNILDTTGCAVTATPMPTPSATVGASATALPAAPTDTPTPTATATLLPTDTPTPIPTATLSPLADTVRDALETYPSIRQELIDAGVIQ